MSNQVTAPGATDIGLLEPFGDHAAEDVRIEGRAIAGEVEGAFLGVKEQEGAHFVEIAHEPFEGAPSHGHDPVLVALALTDMNGLPFPVEIVDFEPGQLAAADSGGVEGFQNGAITEAEVVEDVGHGEQGAGFPETEGLFWQVLFLAGEFEFRGGVGGEKVLFGEPGEVVLEGAQSGALGADAKRHAVFLAPVPEVALIAFEDGLGDGRGVGQVAVDGPKQENLEGVSASLDGVRSVIAHGEVFQIAAGVAGEAARIARGKVVRGVAAPLGAVALAEAVRGLIAFLAGHDDRLLVRGYLLLGKTEDRFASRQKTEDKRERRLCYGGSLARS